MNEMTITSQIRCSRVPKPLVAVIIDGVEDSNILYFPKNKLRGFSKLSIWKVERIYFITK